MMCRTSKFTGNYVLIRDSNLLCSSETDLWSWALVTVELFSGGVCLWTPGMGETGIEGLALHLQMKSDICKYSVKELHDCLESCDMHDVASVLTSRNISAGKLMAFSDADVAGLILTKENFMKLKNFMIGNLRRTSIPFQLLQVLQSWLVTGFQC